MTDNTDAILQLARRIERTSLQLGVRNRQPQGQLVPFPIAGSGVFDSVNAFDLFIVIPSRIYVLIAGRERSRLDASGDRGAA